MLTRSFHPKAVQRNRDQSLLSAIVHKTSVAALVSVFILVTVAGCTSMTTEEKYAHLRDVANKGADAHFVLINENKTTTREECEKHYKVFVPKGAPSESGGAGANSKEWEALSLAYFADSCVTGKPREIQTRSDVSSTSSVPSSSSSTISSEQVAPTSS